MVFDKTIKFGALETRLRSFSSKTHRLDEKEARKENLMGLRKNFAQGGTFSTQMIGKAKSSSFYFDFGCFYDYLLKPPDISTPNVILFVYFL